MEGAGEKDEAVAAIIAAATAYAAYSVRATSSISKASITSPAWMS